MPETFKMKLFNRVFILIKKKKQQQFFFTPQTQPFISRAHYFLMEMNSNEIKSCLKFSLCESKDCIAQMLKRENRNVSNTFINFGVFLKGMG